MAAGTEPAVPAAAVSPWQRLPLGARRGLIGGGAAMGALVLFYAALPGGRGSRSVSPPRKGSALPAVHQVLPHPAAPIAHEDRDALIESIVRSQKKRIMGRKRSLADVARVAMLVDPLVARALEQPSIQGDLRILAAQSGMSLAQYKRYFQHKQEADLLLESGGDPNARSVSNAIGVAQFLAGTARMSGGLKVDLPESRRLSGRIAHLDAEVMALEDLPPDWTKPLPGTHAPILAQKPAPVPPASSANSEVKVAAVPEPGGASTGSGAGAPSSRSPSTAAGADAKTAGGSGSLAGAGSPEAIASAQRSAPNAAGGEAPAAAVTASSSGPAKDSDAGEKSGAGSAETGKEAAGSTGPNQNGESSPALHKSICPTPSPATAVVTRDELIAKRAKELRLLEAKRRQADERYDPAKAIASQTRYLVRMARRYGSLDWVFQAYHGGEGGVRNTVCYYLGDRWRLFGTPEAAIRGTLASRGGATPSRAPLTFEDLYFKTTPLTEPAAFSYLYGRSDNHRYYWWKILAAERAIDLYRHDPAEFRTEWRGLQPGQRLEVVWYPNSKQLDYPDTAALQRAYSAGQLVRWPADARSHGLVLDQVAPLDPANAYQYKGLRPRALKALYRVADLYQANGGGKLPLRVYSLVQTQEYRNRLNSVRPPYWMRHPTKPEDIPIDMEPTGLCFDIERPAADWNRKVLEYALGWMADRNQIYWVEESEQGPRRYHVCPSPDFGRPPTQEARLPHAKKRRAS